ncbi:MAG: LysM domain-containing protein, partial [Planctomycetota bacterium]
LARPEDTDEAGTGLVQQRRKAGGDAVSETVGTYIVQKGDSLSKIAAEVLGSAGRWREIAARNTDRVSPNGNVQVGVMLRIPGTTAGNLNAGGSNTTTRGTEARDPVGERTYTVKGGDTLSEIAAEQLGSARRVRELLKLNSGRIKDADDIRVGMNLMLPAR